MPLEIQSLAEWEAEGIAGLLSIVIPARNEESRLAPTVRAVHAALAAAGIPHEILVVDDGSTDATAAAVEGLAREIAEVRGIANAGPRGFGHAVRAGLAVFRGDAVAIVMADGSDDPGDLVAYARALRDGVDCVFGSRFVRNARVVDYPWLKLTLNRAANTFIRVLFWIPYNDVTNAFKLYRRGVIAGLHPLLSCHFNLTVELPLKAIVRGYSYTVVPTSWYNRTAGVSKFRIKEMGSRYLFIVLYCYLEKYLSRADYQKREAARGQSRSVSSPDKGASMK